MKVLVDMNFSAGWEDLLQSAGHDAVHWSHCGSPDAADSSIIEFARLHRYVLLTHDLDFSAILAATSQSLPSVLQVRAKNLRPSVLGSIVISALSTARAELAQGAIVTATNNRLRIRRLPLDAGDHD